MTANGFRCARRPTKGTRSLIVCSERFRRHCGRLPLKRTIHFDKSKPSLNSDVAPVDALVAVAVKYANALPSPSGSLVGTLNTNTADPFASVVTCVDPRNFSPSTLPAVLGP